MSDETTFAWGIPASSISLLAVSIRKRAAKNLNLLFLPDLHSLDFFKGQPVP
jgi:hypothetical protein